MSQNTNMNLKGFALVLLVVPKGQIRKSACLFGPIMNILAYTLNSLFPYSSHISMVHLFHLAESNQRSHTNKHTAEWKSPNS